MTFGLLNVWKPTGPTSHDIVAAIRRGTGERRVGHAGTLDPLAEGVLVIALGKATRLAEYLTASPKTYRAEIILGITTNTFDSEGTVVAERPLPPDLTRAHIEAALAPFRGAIEQIPPAYSAVKVRGRSAYARVRAGETVSLAPRSVEINTLTLVSFEPPRLKLDVTCSAGTYVRSLAHDLGEALGCGAMLVGLTRTASGRFTLEDAVKWDTLRSAFADGTWQRFLLSADLALGGTPRVQLDGEGLSRIANGLPIPAQVPAQGFSRAYAPDGRFVAVLVGDAARQEWRPKKVFV